MPLFGRDPRRWGRNQDVDLKSLADVDFPVHVRIDIRPAAEAKRAAGACHASQGGVQMGRGWMSILSRLFGEHEDYMRAYPPVDGRHKIGGDLFAGI
jgi:hypothetical protein